MKVQEVTGMERKNWVQNVFNGVMSLTFPSLKPRQQVVSSYNRSDDRVKVRLDYKKSLVGISNEVKRFEQRITEN